MSEELSIATLRHGAAIELIDNAIVEVMENIADRNTDPEEVRRVTMTIKLKPDRKRESVGLDVSVITKVAQPVSFSGVAYLINTREGVKAVDGDPRQPGLYEDETETPEEVDPETGEVVESADKFGGGEA